jgi:cardiolipin synthase A/B
VLWETIADIWPWVLTIDLLLRGVFVARVVLRRAPISISLAWLVVLLFVPVFGVPLYLLVGEVRLGTRRVRRHAELTRDLESRANVYWRGGREDWVEEREIYRPISRLCTAVTNLPPLRGNDLRLIADATSMIDALVEDIAKATRSVDLLTYIWMDTPGGAAQGAGTPQSPTTAGERVGDALIHAARRGVRCRVLVDSVGSRGFLASPLAARMRGAGVRIVGALPVSLWRVPLKRLDIRNHRKITIIDGWIGYCGSQNITDDSFGLDPVRNIGPWIDATVRLEGPAAQALEVVFLRDWQLDAHEEPGKVEDWAIERPLPEGGSVVQVVPTGPGEAARGIGRGFHEALLTSLYAARREIFITTPYFVPDEASRHALIAAAMRGVDVRIVVPRRNDNRLVAAACKANFEDLLRAGIQIFEHERGLLHAKAISIDSDVALIGSANMDMRSFFLNFEATLFVYDTDFASLLRMLQVQYIGESRQVFLDEWLRRPTWQRVMQDAARLLGPLL